MDIYFRLRQLSDTGEEETITNNCSTVYLVTIFWIDKREELLRVIIGYDYCLWNLILITRRTKWNTFYKLYYLDTIYRTHEYCKVLPFWCYEIYYYTEYRSLIFECSLYHYIHYTYIDETDFWDSVCLNYRPQVRSYSSTFLIIIILWAIVWWL